MQQAKKNKKMSLTEAVVTFFKETGGVSNRKAFLPPKKAKLRSLHSKGQPKVRGSRFAVQGSRFAKRVTRMQFLTNQQF